jgi:hypothetical protein
MEWLWVGLLGAAACGNSSADGIAGAAGAPPQLSMPSMMAGSSAGLAPNNQSSANYEGQSKYMIAFYKAYLEDDMRYLDILNAAAASELSDYRHTP